MALFSSYLLEEFSYCIWLNLCFVINLIGRASIASTVFKIYAIKELQKYVNFFVQLTSTYSIIDGTTSTYENRARKLKLRRKYILPVAKENMYEIIN